MLDIQISIPACHLHFILTQYITNNVNAYLTYKQFLCYVYTYIIPKIHYNLLLKYFIYVFTVKYKTHSSKVIFLYLNASVCIITLEQVLKEIRF